MQTGNWRRAAGSRATLCKGPAAPQALLEGPLPSHAHLLHTAGRRGEPSHTQVCVQYSAAWPLCLEGLLRLHEIATQLCLVWVRETSCLPPPEGSMRARAHSGKSLDMACCAGLICNWSVREMARCMYHTAAEVPGKQAPHNGGALRSDYKPSGWRKICLCSHASHRRVVRVYSYGEQGGVVKSQCLPHSVKAAYNEY